jgi:hypothetical protein
MALNNDAMSENYLTIISSLLKYSFETHGRKKSVSDNIFYEMLPPVPITWLKIILFLIFFVALKIIQVML